MGGLRAAEARTSPWRCVLHDEQHVKTLGMRTRKVDGGRIDILVNRARANSCPVAVTHE